MSYYPAQGSHRSHHGHGHGHGHGGSQVVYSQAPYASSGAYPATGYGGEGVVYVPTHSSSHHRHDHHHATPQVITVPSGSGHHHSSRRRHHHSHSHHSRKPTLGERIKRFFGFGNSSRHYKHRSRNESWGFLGRGRRRHYRDAYTGQEVDRKGRPIIRV